MGFCAFVNFGSCVFSNSTERLGFEVFELSFANLGQNIKNVTIQSLRFLFPEQTVEFHYFILRWGPRQHRLVSNSLCSQRWPWASDLHFPSVEVTGMNHQAKVTRYWIVSALCKLDKHPSIPALCPVLIRVLFYKHSTCYLLLGELGADLNVFLFLYLFLPEFLYGIRYYQQFFLYWGLNSWHMLVKCLLLNYIPIPYDRRRWSFGLFLFSLKNLSKGSEASLAEIQMIFAALEKSLSPPS